MMLTKAVWMGALAAAVATTSPAKACNPSRGQPRGGGGYKPPPAVAAPAVWSFPQPMPRPMPSPNGLAGNGLAGNGMGGNGIGPNDVIDIDIPAGAKQAIREAAQAPGAQQWAHPPQFGSANELATAVQRLSIEIATLETKALYGASVSQQLAQKRELMAALQQQVYQAYYGHNRR